MEDKMTRPNKLIVTMFAFVVVLLLMASDLPAQGQNNPLQNLRIRKGPLEIIPYFTFSVESHGNIYLASNDAPELITDGVQVAENPLRKRSGIVLHLDPGVRIFVRPQSLGTRNLYVGFNFIPQVKLFPGAEDIDPFDTDIEKPDLIYINHHIKGDIRYNIGKRFLSLAAGGSFDQPDIAAATNAHFRVYKYWGSVAGFMPLNFKLTAKYLGETFEDDSRGKTAFGSFQGNSVTASLDNQISPLVKVGATYEYHKRKFYGIRDRADEPIYDDSGSKMRPYPQDIDEDTIHDSVKNYEQSTYGGTGRVQIRPNMHASGFIGYSLRKMAERQFGAPEYDAIVGRISLTTTIRGTYWTRLQAYAEHSMTDTYRDMDPLEKNAFTDPELGAFTLLPDDFTVAYSTRMVVDVVQRINATRGDQVLFGVAYQKDRLEDVLSGTLNIFGSGLTTEQRLQRQEEVYGQYNTEPWITERVQEMFIVTAGYRFNLKKWLGLQARGVYYKGDFNESTAIDPAAPVIPHAQDDSGKTDYFAFLGGFVINLNVF
ncbi:hypothetical protein ACFLU6_01730 [Acidobacteriota bacterium]